MHFRIFTAQLLLCIFIICLTGPMLACQHGLMNEDATSLLVHCDGEDDISPAAFVVTVAIFGDMPPAVRIVFGPDPMPPSHGAPLLQPPETA
jgi:hypothetical protein